MPMEYVVLGSGILVAVRFAVILHRAGLLVPWGQRGSGWWGVVGVFLVGCACLTVFGLMSGLFAAFPTALQGVLLAGYLVFAVLWRLASRRDRPSR